jgi:iron complex outermembrane recepter protein
MHNRNKISLVLLSLAASSISLPTSGAVLEEVIVTAQKRVQSAQDVPITISAFSANQLQQEGIKSYDDLGLVTPGLQTSRQIGAATPFLRGVGAQSGTVGNESPTAMYLDGVYVNGTVDAIMSFNNIERIEVLKGPQGTLFGRNTTGGVIHVITADPTFEPQLNLGAHYGSEQTYGGTFYGSVGITDNIAVDLAYQGQRMNDRWGENITTGKDVGFDEYNRTRGKLLWNISDVTRLKLSARYTTRDDDVGMVRQCAPSATFGCMGGSFPLDEHNDTNSNMNGSARSETKAGSIRFEHSFQWADFVSISSYKDNTSTQTLDQDAGPMNLIRAPLNQTIKTFTQEFQLLSNDGDAPFSWIVGAYYYDDSSEYDPLGLSGIAASFLAPPATSVEIYSKLETESYAAFAETTWHFSDVTDFTAGIRYTNDDRENSGHTDYLAPGYFNTSKFSGDHSWDKPTWRLAVNHFFTENVSTYVSYNRGFKSGVYDTVNSAGVVKEPVEPETLDAYEIGMKGDFMDGSLRLNLAAFYYEYDNMQLQKIDAGNSILLNAAEGEISGFEADAEAAVTDNLTLRFGLSYLDTEYKDFPGCPVNTPSTGPFGGQNSVTLGDCSGNEVVRAPEYTYNIGGNYQIPTRVGTFGASGVVSYNDGFFWEPDNRAEEGDYTIINAELSWRSNDEKYLVRVYGKNLGDEEFSVYTTEASFGDTLAPAPPLTYGVAFEMFMF